MSAAGHYRIRARPLSTALLQGGDLYDALHVGKERLEWKAGGCRLAAQIALGLSKLHARKVICLWTLSSFSARCQCEGFSQQDGLECCVGEEAQSSSLSED